MTCIVGLKDVKNNKVIIASDSLASSCYESYQAKTKKVFENNGFIFGCTTSYRMIQILNHIFEPPKINHNEDFEKYMARKFIPKMRKLFNEHGFGKSEKYGQFILGYKNNMITIQDDLSFMNHENNYHSVGSGYGFALGSMYSSQFSGLSECARLILALGAAKHHAPGVGGDCYFIDSIKKQVTLLV